MNRPEIKICGITKENEIEFLTEARVDYAGFVLFEKSKRYVNVVRAKELLALLPEEITPVAVTVSPALSDLKEIEESGFHILQIHKELNEELLAEARIPIWYAVNISELENLEKDMLFLRDMMEKYPKKLTGLVVDGASFGSGKTFCWREEDKNLNLKEMFGLPFALAGGLNSSNVKEGISIYSPDIVDVSSGVEGQYGKDRTLILDFVRKVRE